MQCEEHGVVEQCIDIALITRNIGNTSVEILTHLKNASRSSILLPEILANFRDRVDADAVKFILRNHTVDPGLKVGTYVCVILVQVGQTR